MNLNEAKVKLKNFKVINKHGFIETINTKYSEKELEDVSIDLFNTLDNYVIDKYGCKLFNIKPKRSIIELELTNNKIKHLRK
ncbi:hypothetical protein SPJ221_117 [Staphylococcus phage vB_SauH_SPJ2]|nr:hypothetical protein LSA2308_00085 [Staphylococcus phage LSA2308]USZ62924.1 hypothetical protein LSA2311_orf00117 [Staphylococcus phage LSA2311]WEW53666.1 hypothetical protein SPJ221_117 [Staphylococcus phage vB_SauH_SPJ2]